MAIKVEKIKTIGKLNNKGLELSQTKVKGLVKNDIRVWKDDGKYEKGVRLSDEELGVLKGIINEIKSEPTKKSRQTKKQNFVIIEQYGVIAKKDKTELQLNYVKWFDNAPAFDLRSWIDGFAKGGITMTYAELKKLGELIAVEPKKKPVVTKKSVATKKSTTKKTTTKKKKKTYSSAYEKFLDQFTEYEKTQPKEHQHAYNVVYTIIVDHIKDIEETSEAYKKNALNDKKNSQGMMTYVRDEYMKNYDEISKMKTREDEQIFMLSKVDEYIGKEEK